MTETLTIPNPPTSPAEAIACFTALGQALKTTMEAVEANPSWFGHVRSVKRAHRLLDEAGYLLEDLTGVPPETYGAGGGGPKP